MRSTTHRRNRQETSEEIKLKEADDTVLWLNPSFRGRASRSVQYPWRGGRILRKPWEPQEGTGVENGVRRCERMKASKGEPQGRIRDEISPIGPVGSKASRG